MMDGKVDLSNPARRNRIIAVVAGAITVVAIVLGFAGDVLGLPWHWMRPAAELLLLAELVVLVVLERHQLFEPVHETVALMNRRTVGIDERLGELVEKLSASGRVTVCTSPPEIMRTIARVIREALARDQGTPKILRSAALSGRAFFGERWNLEAEFSDFAKAITAPFLLPTSPADSLARQWSVRMLAVFSDKENFDRWWERVFLMTAGGPLNLEVKFVAGAAVQAVLSPQIITDSDVLLGLDDQVSVFHW
jgi:hypothetical protein